MSKKKKVDNAQETVVVEETQNAKAVESGVVETTKDSKKKAKDDKKEVKKDAKKDKKKDKKDKNKKGLIKKTKETASELKKVTWPSFGEVVKKTGIVIAFVIIFGLLVFGVDTLLGYLVTLLV